jgi:hypothetical protein
VEPPDAADFQRTLEFVEHVTRKAGGPEKSRETGCPEKDGKAGGPEEGWETGCPEKD